MRDLLEFLMSGGRTVWRPVHFVVRLDRALSKISSLMAMLGILALIMASAVVVGDVVWRRIGGGSFIGSVDLTQLSVMIAVSWSIPYAFSMGAHVSVDLVSQSFGAKTNRVLNTLACLAGFGVVAFLCWLSFGRAIEIYSYGDISQDLGIPMIWFWGNLVLGLALSGTVSLVRAIRIGLGDERPN